MIPLFSLGKRAVYEEDIPSIASLRINSEMLAAAQEIVETSEELAIEKSTLETLVRAIVWLDRQQDLTRNANS